MYTLFCCGIGSLLNKVGYARMGARCNNPSATLLLHLEMGLLGSLSFQYYRRKCVLLVVEYRTSSPLRIGGHCGVGRRGGEVSVSLGPGALHVNPDQTFIPSSVSFCRI